MSKYFLFTTLLFAAIFSGCKKAAEYEDAIFFTGTEQAAETKFTIDGPSSIGLTVSSSSKVGADVNVSLTVDSGLVASYNRQKGTAYQFLPNGSYGLDNGNVIITQGTSVSAAAKFSVLSLADFKDGVTYCVPVTISDAGGTKVLESSRTIYIIINRTIITPAAVLSPNYFTVPSFLTATTLSSIPRVTFECRIFMNSFQTANPFISSIMGIEENFLLRLGDVSIANNQLQLAGGIISGKSHPVSSKAFFATGQWYHVAMVYNNSTISLYVNGMLDNYTDAGSGGVNLTDSYSGGFHIGFSAGGRLLNGYVSEARVWSKALTAAELQNNLCFTDPTSKDLIAYWRFNGADASGNVTDLTGHGYTAVAARATSFVQGIRCPK
jgi:hypothetical protein